MRTIVWESALALSCLISLIGCQQNPSTSVDLAGPSDMSMAADLTSGSDLSTSFDLALGTPGNSYWARRPITIDGDLARHVAVDSAGSAFVTGYFTTSADFGGGTLTSAGGQDIFLAKYATDGTPLWGKRLGDTSDDQGWSVATDGSGNVVVVGEFQGSADFGGGALTSAGFSDIFIAKYNAAGGYLWAKRLGGIGIDEARSVAVDGTGNILVTGQFSNMVDFGGGALSSAGNSDIFLAKYAPDGAHLFSKRFGGTDYDSGNGVTADSGGNILLVGQFYLQADFGGGLFTDKGVGDIFIAKYSASGTHIFSRSFGDVATDQAWSVAADPSGNLVVIGDYNGSINFGGGSLPAAGGQDIFVAKYNTNGTHVWSKRFGGLGTDTASAIATDKSGNVIIGGSFYGSVNFGGGSLTAGGLTDIIVAKYAPDGSHVFSRRFGTTNVNAAMGVAADSNANVFAAGYFCGTVDFGYGPVSSPDVDMFLLKRAP